MIGELSLPREKNIRILVSLNATLPNSLGSIDYATELTLKSSLFTNIYNLKIQYKLTILLITIVMIPPPNVLNDYPFTLSYAILPKLS